MSPREIYGHTLLAAVQALNPQSAPLVGALVRSNAVLVDDSARGPLLDLLASLGDSEPNDGPTVPQMLMVIAHGGNSPEAWALLRRLGLSAAVTGAVMFAMLAASALVDLTQSTNGGAPTAH
jgi:hypothetical protein